MLSGSWKTSVIGILAGVMNYFVTLGPNLPQTSADWGHAGMSAVLFAFGAMAKDANISNSPIPGPPQTVK